MGPRTPLGDRIVLMRAIISTPWARLRLRWNWSNTELPQVAGLSRTDSSGLADSSFAITVSATLSRQTLQRLFPSEIPPSAFRMHWPGLPLRVSPSVRRASIFLDALQISLPHTRVARGALTGQTQPTQKQSMEGSRT